MQVFHSTTSALQQRFAPGFLFKATPGSHSVHVQVDALQHTLTTILKGLGIDNGETFTGIRASGATQAMITGAELQQLMQTANWSCPATAAYYTRLQELLGLQTVPDIMSKPQDPMLHIDELASLVSAYT
jgi:hypothetical protein